MVNPQLDPREWVFCAVDASFPLALTKPLLVFHEDESTTIVIETENAKRFDLPYEFVCRRITAGVSTALNAVGFIAKLAAALAERGIAVNVVSAFHHDHLFVPADRAGEAMQTLQALSASAGSLDQIVDPL